MKTIPLLTALALGFLGASSLIQTYKNREFRQRLNALEAQLVEVKLRLDLHELPFPRRMDTIVIQPELPTAP